MGEGPCLVQSDGTDTHLTIIYFKFAFSSVVYRPTGTLIGGKVGGRYGIDLRPEVSMATKQPL